jgi:anti-sigma factor RsiW
MSSAPATIVCKDLVELVTDYLEGALPPDAVVRLEAHLSGCDGCTRYLAQLRTTIRLTGMLTEADLPADGRAELLAAFRAWRDERAT